MRFAPYIAFGASLVSAAPLSIFVSTTEVGSFRLGNPVNDVKTGAMIAPPSGMRKACNKMQGGVAKLFAMAGLGPVIAHDMKLGPEHRVAHLPGEKQFWDPALPPHHLKWHHKGEDREALVTVAENGGAVEPPRHPHHMHHGGHFRHMHHRGSFIRRIHRALMSLGPWEGRAIAFVLGCGIGVLLRMLWVMFVVLKRVLRTEQDERSEDEAEYERVAVLLPLEVENGEELFVAPPEYSVDEKAPLPEDVKN